jgi:hypothetical protein
VRPKGLRQIATIQNMRNRSVPRTREQVMTELARLEHERVRLTRTGEVWAANLRRTEDQLQGVLERIALLEQSLDPPSAEGAPRPRSAPAPAREDDADTWTPQPLEY